MSLLVAVTDKGRVKHNQTALHKAVEKQDLDELMKLLDGGADIEISGGKNGETPLIYASYLNGGWPDGMKLLIERKADLNATKGYQRTPLMLAAEFNRAESVEVLLEAGADATLRYIDGRSPADWAKSYGHTALVAPLQQAQEKQLALIRGPSRAPGSAHPMAHLLK